MQIGLYVVGTLKERYWKDACAEYQKRLSPGFVLREFKEERLPKNPSAQEIQIALEKESHAVIDKLPKEATLILLTKEGVQYDSEFLAKKVSAWKGQGNPLVFFIGSSYGIGEGLRKRAQYTLSFSSLTFPHQLMRVLFLEQLYRVENIIANTKYHK